MRNQVRIDLELSQAGVRRRILALVATAPVILGGCADIDGASSSPDPADAILLAASGGGVTVDVVTTEVWNGGFNGAVRVTSNSFGAPISSFAVVFQLDGSASISGTAWNGTISPPDGSGSRTASSPSWLQFNPIATGQSFSVGFPGSGTFAGAAITALTVNGQAIPIGGGGGGGDTTPPSVSLVASASTVTTAGPLTLTAGATDNVGVSRVEFRDGTQLLGSDTSNPFAFTVNLTSAQNGTHSYTARAFDGAENSSTSSPVQVTVNIATATGPAKFVEIGRAHV